MDLHSQPNRPSQNKIVGSLFRASRLIFFPITTIIGAIVIGSVGAISWSLISLVPINSIVHNITDFFGGGEFLIGIIFVALLVVPPIVLSVAAFSAILQWGRRHGVFTGEEILAANPGLQPVLYLRSFASDQRFADAEEAMADYVFSGHAPFIAIGKPGDKLPPLGASRVYVDHNEWQNAVMQHLDRAQLVIILIGSTPGLGWELTECRQRIDPRRLLILVSANRTDYESFSSVAKNASIELPAISQLGNFAAGGLIGLVKFDKQWGPKYCPFERLPTADYKRYHHQIRAPFFDPPYAPMLYGIYAVARELGITK
jgi:hypothetical protein